MRLTIHHDYKHPLMVRRFPYTTKYPDLPQKQRQRKFLFFPEYYDLPAHTLINTKFSTQPVCHTSTMKTAYREKSNATDAQLFRSTQRVRTNYAQRKPTSRKGGASLASSRRTQRTKEYAVRTTATNLLSTRRDVSFTPPTSSHQQSLRRRRDNKKYNQNSARHAVKSPKEIVGKLTSSV